LDWASSTTAPIRETTLSRKAGDGIAVRAFGSLLEVDLSGSGAHALGLGTLDGRTLAERAGSGPAHYTFTGLDAAGIYTLTTTTAGGRSVRLVR
jgi:hypothetical protein